MLATTANWLANMNQVIKKNQSNRCGGLEEKGTGEFSDLKGARTWWGA